MRALVLNTFLGCCTVGGLCSFLVKLAQLVSQLWSFLTFFKKLFALIIFVGSIENVYLLFRFNWLFLLKNLQCFDLIFFLVKFRYSFRRPQNLKKNLCEKKRSDICIFFIFFTFSQYLNFTYECWERKFLVFVGFLLPWLNDFGGDASDKCRLKSLCLKLHNVWIVACLLAVPWPFLGAAGSPP